MDFVNKLKIATHLSPQLLTESLSIVNPISGSVVTRQKPVGQNGNDPHALNQTGKICSSQFKKHSGPILKTLI